MESWLVHLQGLGCPHGFLNLSDLLRAVPLHWPVSSRPLGKFSVVLTSLEDAGYACEITRQAGPHQQVTSVQEAATEAQGKQVG